MILMIKNLQLFSERLIFNRFSFFIVPHFCLNKDTCRRVTVASNLLSLSASSRWRLPLPRLFHPPAALAAGLHVIMICKIKFVMEVKVTQSNLSLPCLLLHRSALSSSPLCQGGHIGSDRQCSDKHCWSKWGEGRVRGGVVDWACCAWKWRNIKL